MDPKLSDGKANEGNGKRKLLLRWVGVTSSVSQGSVLRPLLFLLFADEIPELAQSKTRYGEGLGKTPIEKGCKKI